MTQRIYFILNIGLNIPEFSKNSNFHVFIFVQSALIRIRVRQTQPTSEIRVRGWRFPASEIVRVRRPLVTNLS